MDRPSVAIVTSGRADYGALRPLVQELYQSNWCEVLLVAIGSHLQPRFGLTVNEVVFDNHSDFTALNTSLGLDGEINIASEVASTIKKVSAYLIERKPSIMVILGDRMEILAAACAAVIVGVPVAHLHGGEATEGLTDDYVRHAITKLSYLHFVSNDQHNARVVQMGENPQRVFTVGAIGLDNLRNHSIPARSEILEHLGIPSSKRVVICTYHPLTLDLEASMRELHALLTSLQKITEDFFILFTGVNSDVGHTQVQKAIQHFQQTADNVGLVESLGTKKYFDLISVSEFVIGNSSSGIIEVPSFNVPTIDVGQRQKGRIRGESVVSVAGVSSEIDVGISYAMDLKEKMNQGVRFKNPYMQVMPAAIQISDTLRSFTFKSKDRFKPFFDLEKNCDK